MLLVEEAVFCLLKLPIMNGSAQNATNNAMGYLLGTCLLNAKKMLWVIKINLSFNVKIDK